ncbi:MAG: hypothetical protein KAX55_09295, partial [Propionivibrio sp.]|nr:hypothetical protein [Propionivibrio sp.]
MSELEIPVLIKALLKLERNVTTGHFSGQSSTPCSHNVLRVGQNRSFGPTGPITGKKVEVEGRNIGKPVGRVEYFQGFSHARHWPQDDRPGLF